MLAYRGVVPPFAGGPVVTPQHDAAYWAAVTAGFDFSQADQVPPAQFNRVLWAGLMRGKPYPSWAETVRSKIRATDRALAVQRSPTTPGRARCRARFGG